MKAGLKAAWGQEAGGREESESDMYGPEERGWGKDIQRLLQVGRVGDACNQVQYLAYRLPPHQARRRTDKKVTHMSNAPIHSELHSLPPPTLLGTDPQPAGGAS